MKPTSINPFLIKLLLAAVCITPSAHAAIATKSATGTDLTDTTGVVWTGGSGTGGSPTGSDVATWDTSSLGAGLTAATDVTWGSISIGGALTNIDITGAGLVTAGNITLAGTKTLSIANNIALSANLIYTIADVSGSTATDATLSGIISGTGFGITKAGAGTLTFSGANSFTGGTTINGGTLALDYTAQNNDKIAAGAALTFGGGNLTITGNAAADTTQSVLSTTLNAGSSVITVNKGATSGNATLNLGTITRSVGGTMNVVYGGAGSGTATATTTAGNTNGILGPWAAVGTGASTRYATVDGSNNIVAYSGGTAAATNADLTDTTGNVNYDLGAVGGTAVSNFSANTIRFTGAHSSANVTTNTATGTNLFSVNGLMNVGAGAVGKFWIVGAAGTTETLTIGGNKELVVNTTSTTSNIYIPAIIADNAGGTSSLTKTGAGQLIIAGDNAYSGGTTFSAGTVQVGVNTAAGKLGSGPVINNAALTFSYNAAVTISNDISGNGTLSKLGIGTLTLSGNNSYTNTITVTTGATAGTYGTIKAGSATAFGSTAGGVVVVGGATVDLNGQIIGAEAFSIAGAGISSGGAFINSNTGTAASLTGAVTMTAASSVGGAGNLTLSGAISGGFALTKVGAGSLALSGTNTYTGLTNIQAGTLIVGVTAPSGAAGALGNATTFVQFGGATAAALLTGGAVAVGRNIDVLATAGAPTLGGNTDNASIFSGSINLRKNLSITQVATTGANTLQITGGITSNTSGAKTVTFDNAGNVLVSTTAIQNGSGTIALTKSNTGTLTLSGANTYTGNTTVNGGTLTLADDAQLAFVIGANGVNNKITGTGTALLQGDFNLNLTGASTTTGNEWTLVDVGTLTETFDTTFTLVGFSKIGGVHTKVVPGSPTVIWTFTESDGKLKVTTGSDYDTWLSGFTFAGGGDTTSIGDPDGDGLKNLQEYAFGLNPASGSSVSPITVMLDKTTGTFTYTRRKPSLTGMTYKIETSSTLVGWTEDATASQLVTGTVGDIETVQVTLSGPVPLTSSNFFVRVCSTQP